MTSYSGASRGAYRPSQSERIAGIETRRKRAGITLEALCARAGVATATYRRMRRAGLAFPRHINALAMALRSMERERRQSASLFPVAG